MGCVATTIGLVNIFGKPGCKALAIDGSELGGWMVLSESVCVSVGLSCPQLSAIKFHE